MGHDHVVPGATDELFPCSNRRLDRFGARKGRDRSPFMAGNNQDSFVHLYFSGRGACLGFAFGGLVYTLFQNASPSRVDNLFRKGQLLSAAMYSMGHGGNDAQKTMGIVASLLFTRACWGRPFTSRSGWLWRATRP